MTAGPTDLFDLNAEWLAACEAALATTDGGTPARSFVSLGPPAWDCCPQLTVHSGYALADTAPIGPPLSAGHRTTVQGGVYLVPLVATVIRCVPTLEDNGDPPTAADLEAAAMTGMADAWAITNHTWDQHAKGILFAPVEREMFIDPTVPLQQAGGCGGFQIQIRVALYGYKSAT